MYCLKVFWLEFAVWLTIAVFAVVIAFPSRSKLERERKRFLDRFHAYLDPCFVDAFDRDARRTARLLGVLLVVGGTVMLFVADRIDSADPPHEVNLWLAIVPVAAFGLVLYPVVRLRAVDRLFRVPDYGTAVARPVRVEVSDYVGGWTRLLTWALVALTLCCTATLATLWIRGDVPGAFATIAAVDSGLALSLMLVTEWFGRALAARPTPAVDASHLYLQDAWRASVLSRAHINVGYICHLLFYGLIFSFSLPGWFYDGPILLVVMGTTSAYPLLQYVQPRQFRRRLWRGLAPGQILLPGQQLPPPQGAGA